MVMINTTRLANFIRSLPDPDKVSDRVIRFAYIEDTELGSPFDKIKNEVEVHYINFILLREYPRNRWVLDIKE